MCPSTSTVDTMQQQNGQQERAENVGILAAEAYFPYIYIKQDELEKHDGAPSGKYSIGLGQQGLAFCGDREDSISMSLTVLKQLLEKHSINPMDVGRLDVGTESAVDDSKSIKSHLMMLFEEAGNTDIEGVDCIQACYGGTAAVQNAVNWVDSRSWDGRYAVVVMADISIYPKGPARPTSGAGAVALLIGPDAPLVVEQGISATHMAHAYDFYKPNGLYPAVDGPLSVYCYLATLDQCYLRYCKKFEKRFGRAFSMDEAEHALFHAPYNKLVQKAFARLLYLDHCQSPGRVSALEGLEMGEGPHPCHPSQVPPDLQKSLLAASFKTYDSKVRPSTCVQRQCGNMYTASIWSGIAQIIETRGSALEGRRILMYSYGSGISASIFSIVGRHVGGKFNLGSMQSKSDLAMRLARRMPKSAEEFEQAMQLAEQRYRAGGYKTEYPPLSELLPGTYYLVEVDTRYRRVYALKS